MKTENLLLGMAIAFSFLFLSQSCEKIKDEINKAAAFEVELDQPDKYFLLDSANFKSSSGILANWKVMYEFAVFVNVDSLFNANDLSSASIKDGTVSKVKVSIDNPPPGVNFDFVNEMKVTVSQDISFSSETLVASTGAIPTGSTSVSFNLNNANITSYIDNYSFYIRLYGDKNAPVPIQSILMLLKSSVKFTVEPV